MKTQKDNLDRAEAKNEPEILPESILAELKPIMQDYFLGKVLLKENYILYRMPNGQKIKLIAKRA